jgi:aspartyl-tRNA(Asn)/glutamyl-tRNA(Gln) amidotransferase subunit A
MSGSNEKQFNLRELSRQVQNRETRVEALVSDRLEKANQSDSVFVSINQDILARAREIDEAISKVHQGGDQIPLLSGLPITLKDLFDVEGEVTLAGSTALKHVASTATHDCEVVAPLRKSGLLFLGRTNMSEFAFSGMGLNPHYGNPQSVWDRETGRLPGGSSSGSAVSVAEGIVAATMGSDTAGSCRIPAAFNGIVGVKPSWGRYSLNNVYPLSPTSDAPGPLAVDVDSCFLLDQVITGAQAGNAALPRLQMEEHDSISLLVPESVVLEDLDDEVQKGFENALGWLQDAGVEIKYRPMPVIDQCVDMFFKRPVVGYEAWQHHQSLVREYGDEYDPFVCQRLKNSRKITEQEQQARYREKTGIGLEINKLMAQEQVSAVIYPTVPCIPPPISETLKPENMAKTNLRCLRNTATVNYFNGCSVSLPCHYPGEAPVGLMVSSGLGRDDYLYRVAATVENVLNSNRECRS